MRRPRFFFRSRSQQFNFWVCLGKLLKFSVEVHVSSWIPVRELTFSDRVGQMNHYVALPIEGLTGTVGLLLGHHFLTNLSSL